jgi:hypothetical protein
MCKANLTAARVNSVAAFFNSVVKPAGASEIAADFFSSCVCGIQYRQRTAHAVSCELERLCRSAGTFLYVFED